MPAKALLGCPSLGIEMIAAARELAGAKCIGALRIELVDDARAGQEVRERVSADAARSAVALQVLMKRERAEPVGGFAREDRVAGSSDLDPARQNHGGYPGLRAHPGTVVAAESEQIRKLGRPGDDEGQQPNADRSADRWRD